jgi:hypothetical protein
MSKKPITRREFAKTAGIAVAGGIALEGIGSTPSFAAVPSFDADPYRDRTVVRVYDPTASAFDWSGAETKYWRKLDAGKTQDMLEKGIMRLTGESIAASAWAKILPDASSSSKVAVKINLGNMMKTRWREALLTDPPMIIALAKSLATVGIAQLNVTFFDGSRTLPDDFKTEVKRECPKVVMQGNGNCKSSTTNINVTGVMQLPIPAPVMEADCRHDSGIARL